MQNTRISFLRNKVKKVLSFVLVIVRPNEARDILHSYKDIGGKEAYTAVDLIRMLLVTF